MVTFNELRINNANNTLIVDCTVEDLTIYSDVYIKSIELYHYKNADSSGEPVNLSKVLTIFENDDDDTTIRTVRKCVPDTFAESVFGISVFEKGIFFVRVTCDGTLPPQTMQFACGYDDMVDIGVVVDWKYLFDIGMGLIASMDVCGNICKSNDNLEQFILTWFSLRLALEACDFDQLGILWDRFLRLSAFSTTSKVSGCGCHNM